MKYLMKFVKNLYIISDVHTYFFLHFYPLEKNLISSFDTYQSLSIICTQEIRFNYDIL